MGAFDRIIDQILSDAVRDGVFDNLPGAGKPLRLEENPHEPEDWRIAFRVLKNSGHTLPWIALRAEIEQERTRLLHARLERPAFEQQIAALNVRILEYNLQVPGPAFQRMSLYPEAEWQAAQSGGRENLPSESTDVSGAV